MNPCAICFDIIVFFAATRIYAPLYVSRRQPLDLVRLAYIRHYQFCKQGIDHGFENGIRTSPVSAEHFVSCRLQEYDLDRGIILYE